LPRAGGALSGALLVVSSSLARLSIQGGVSIGQCTVVALVRGFGAQFAHGGTPVGSVRSASDEGVARNRKLSQIGRSERAAGSGVIAPRRSNIARLRRPWRATSECAVAVSYRRFSASNSSDAIRGNW
jgi:hypothetical protein